MSHALTVAMGARLRDARLGAGMSRESLAVAAGVSYRCVQSIERGNRWPRIATAAALTDALGHEFITRTGGPVVRVDGVEDTEAEWTRRYIHHRTAAVVTARVFCGDAWQWFVSPAVGKHPTAGHSCQIAAKVAATRYLHTAGFGAMGASWDVDG